MGIIFYRMGYMRYNILHSRNMDCYWIPVDIPLLLLGIRRQKKTSTYVELKSL